MDKITMIHVNKENVSYSTSRTYQSPPKKGYDNGYLELCNIHEKLITQIYSEDSSPIEPFKEEDVSKAVKQLNAGKAADEYDTVAEHLKMTGGVIIPYATKIF